MKIPRALRARRPRTPAARRLSSRRPGAAASLGIAAAIALLAPDLVGRTVADPAAEGIELASTCDAQFDATRERWSACIASRLRGLSADPIATAAVHFHAWLVADRAARHGVREAASLRDAHLVPLRDALRVGTTGLHRLCAASGTDCTAVGRALEPST